MLKNGTYITPAGSRVVVSGAHSGIFDITFDWVEERACCEASHVVDVHNDRLTWSCSCTPPHPEGAADLAPAPIWGAACSGRVTRIRSAVCVGGPAGGRVMSAVTSRIRIPVAGVPGTMFVDYRFESLETPQGHVSVWALEGQTILDTMEILLTAYQEQCADAQRRSLRGSRNEKAAPPGQG